MIPAKSYFFATIMRNDETIRVISFRRASDKEQALFQKYTGDDKLFKTRLTDNRNY